MPSRPSKRFVLNWLKALLLSPGMLFPATYLLLYFSTTLYLNTALKSEVIKTLMPMGHISVRTVTTDMTLERITLHNVTLQPSAIGESKKPQHIRQLTIACPKLIPQLFTKQGRTQTICQVEQALSPIAQ
uniref:Uncharacterized protein n=1 Tax=Chlorobium chlorochromatii (strain CaD3) TaxID=340177 RepID=Q3ATB0_CHLCH